MNLKSLILSSALLFSGNNYNLGEMLPQLDNMAIEYYNYFNAFELYYENDNFYLSNSLATNNDANKIPIDSKYLLNLNVSDPYVSGTYYSEIQIYSLADSNNYSISFTFDYYTFTGYPKKLDSINFEFEFDSVGSLDPIGYSIDGDSAYSNIASDISLWADTMLNSNDSTITSSIFDIVGETVSSYVSSITSMFNELMLLFYADNKLTYLSQLILLGFGIGITKWGMNFFKDSVRL